MGLGLPGVWCTRQLKLHFTSGTGVHCACEMKRKHAGQDSLALIDFFVMTLGNEDSLLYFSNKALEMLGVKELAHGPTATTQYR